MKKLLAILLLCASTVVQAWTQRPPQDLATCKIHAPWGFPQTSGVQTICRQAYLVGYDAAAKIPRYVTYNLTSQNALGCVIRTNTFTADQSIKNGARTSDYVGTGFDKGHMSPSGDLSWDAQVEFESFLMTNISPQAPSLNRGIWKLLETSIRDWTVSTGQSYTVHVGSLYNSSDKKIGKAVTVPHAFYKIVINNTTGQAAAWQFPHVKPYPNLGKDLTKFRTPIDQIEKSSGVDFAFPVDVKELNAGQEWPVNFGDLSRAKQSQCGINAAVD